LPIQFHQYLIQNVARKEKKNTWFCFNDHCISKYMPIAWPVYQIDLTIATLLFSCAILLYNVLWSKIGYLKIVFFWANYCV
jgi:hypothetical protein